MDLFTYQIIIFTLFLFSGFFSGAETAIISSRYSKLEELSKKRKRSALRSLYILDNIEDAMSMILIGNNVVNISAAAFITYVAKTVYILNDNKLFIVTLIQTVLFLIFCEISPKLIARAKPEKYLMVISYPLKTLMIVTYPVIKLTLFVTDLFYKIFKFDIKETGRERSRKEIGLLFNLGQKDGIVTEEDENFVSEILSFKEIAAFEVMTPITDIISIKDTGSIKQLVSLIKKTKFSRIPVYHERVDNIIGYIFYRDILKNGNIEKVEDYITPPYYVPSSKNIYELYMEMYEKFIPIVFVVNEYGGIIGMVSNEDIAEELVGEINTIDHGAEELISEINEREYILSGDLDIEYFEKYFSVKIEKKGFETLAGFISYQMGKIPKMGDNFMYKKVYSFCVEEASERAVEKIKFKIKGKLKKKG